MQPLFSIIVAFSENEQGIGYNNKIPWNIPADIQHFKQITSATKNPDKKNAVIMGRKTYDSLPPKVKPLPGRFNVVISRTAQQQQLANKTDRIEWVDSLQSAFNAINQRQDIENIFVIGGESIYKEAILLPNCEKIYATVISNQHQQHQQQQFDTFFPPIPNRFSEITIEQQTEKDHNLQFLVYQTNNKQNKGYSRMIVQTTTTYTKQSAVTYIHN